MAGRIMNRRELRKQAEAADATQQLTATPAEGVVEEAPKKKTRAKATGASKVRKPRAKKGSPRMRARWGLFDAAMKQVAVFDFNQRAAAEAKLADLLAVKKGAHFMQMVKDLMPEEILAEAPPTGQAG